MKNILEKLKARGFAAKTDYAALLRDYNSDGYFNDINYMDESRARWQVHISLHRTNLLAQGYGYNKDSIYYADESIAEIVNKCVEYFFENDFRNSNWWYNDIGVPQQLRSICLYMGNKLVESLRNRIIDRLNSDVDERWTGANKIWYAENVIFKGLFLNDKALIKKGINYMEDEIYIADGDKEGIKPDCSFAQHGMQLYNHGYGLSYLSEAANWINVFSDSDFAFSNDKVEILLQYMLHGGMRMGRYREMDFSARGREFTRGFFSDRGMRQYMIPARILEKYASDSDKAAIKRFAERLKGAEYTAEDNYNSMYPYLDFMTHNRTGFYSSVRMANKNIIGSEFGNGENTNGGFQSYGTCIYMKTGEEYKNIYPVWDWGYIPGTTTPHTYISPKVSRQDTEFTAFLSDGIYGFAATDLKKTLSQNGEVSFGGRKAYFFFDKQVVHLGNSLYSTASECLNTTLDQCYLNGDVKVEGEILNRSDSLREVKSKEVRHNGIIYKLLDDNVFMVKNGKQSGGYHTIAEGVNIPADTIEKDIFTVLIPHGINSEEAAYKYIVFPDGEAEAAKILANDSIQAVCCDNTVCAVFYECGVLEHGNLIIKAEGRCMVMITETQILAVAPESTEVFVKTADIEYMFNANSRITPYVIKL